MVSEFGGWVLVPAAAADVESNRTGTEPSDTHTLVLGG